MKIKLKHETLRGLRDGRSIPPKAMADKLGLSLSEYEIYELDDKEVTIKFAEKVAKIFSRNWSVFLLDEEPKKIKLEKDNRTYENRTPTLHEKTIGAIENASFVLDFSKGLSTSLTLHLPEYEKIKNLNAEDLGTKIRGQSKISIDDQINFSGPAEALSAWIDFVGSQGVYVSQFSLDSKKDKIRAFSIFRNKQAIIVLNSSEILPARIFSLIHEYGHILRRSYGYCDLYDSGNSGVEVFCNAFAASFLIPLEIISDYISKKGKDAILDNLDSSVVELSNRLKVSKSVIYRRFHTVGVISDEHYSSIYKKTSQFFGNGLPNDESETKIKKASKGGPDPYYISYIKNGSVYTNSVLKAQFSGEITEFEASKALGIKFTNLNKYKNKSAQYEEKWGRKLS